MKTIKKTPIFLALLALIAVTSLQSCQKYSEGPMLSVRSRKERVSNHWEVENYKINGNDLTSLYQGYNETFSKSGDYSYEWGILDGTGTWNFQNNDMEIKLTGDSDQTSRTLFILKLEEKAFWYYYIKNGDKHEFHLIGN
jgi:hypothetical protein